MAKPVNRTLEAMAAETRLGLTETDAETRFGGLPQVILRTLIGAGGRANG